MRYRSHGPRCGCIECRLTGCGLLSRGHDICIDCDGVGRYPSGAACKSCEGSGRVLPGDGIKPPVTAL